MVNHLDEKRIQDFLDKNLNTVERAAIRQHIDQCDVCRDKVHAMQHLYSILEEDTDFELPKNFTARVLKKTHQYAMGSLQFGLLQLFFVLATIIVAINVMLSYVQVNKFVQTAETTSASFREIFTIFASLFGNIYEKIQFDGFYIVLIFIGLLGLFALDRFILQPRFKTTH